MSFPLSPRSNQLVVLRDPPLPTTPGGLLDLPDNALRRTNTALVLAVGPGRYDQKRKITLPCTVKPGERIWLPALCGTDVILTDGMVYTLVREEDVWAVIEEEV